MFKDLKKQSCYFDWGIWFFRYAICKALAQEGCIVINLDIKKNLVFEKKIKTKKLKIDFIKCDITNINQIKKCKNRVFKKLQEN